MIFFLSFGVIIIAAISYYLLLHKLKYPKRWLILTNLLGPIIIVAGTWKVVGTLFVLPALIYIVVSTWLINKYWTN
ncbi:hypothetical protein GPK34_09520 [Secundilactobacillus kimchicus]|uniref:Uncharacterized protein n=1 Tax=Secundilactobacillus kimchicus JCM 15530 TaxID=1302272 RepID=A0A0R1HKY9_9LACO|nr:hypothetical protein [Secundilactobacillus kimchicus]KRK47373.1 hypothetical protein FC96_GL002492 [Secundilactobacillus kimchicus JCM 15530]MBT9672271.1 hypothetical protein [Secundilactobacillus kimchicus]